MLVTTAQQDYNPGVDHEFIACWLDILLYKDISHFGTLVLHQEPQEDVTPSSHSAN